jgi:hypothetical protein
MTKEEIIRTCMEFNIKNYTITDDGIDVDGPVDLRNRNLEQLPLKFRTVKGYFDCSHNKLTSLIGAPKTVLKNFFVCNNNLLTDLKGAPQEVETDFICSNNLLESLEGCPQIVREFSCRNNNLQTLEGGPKIVQTRMDCSLNPIYTFQEFPVVYHTSKIVLNDCLEFLTDYIPRNVLFNPELSVGEMFDDYRWIRPPKNPGEKPRINLEILHELFIDIYKVDIKINPRILTKYYKVFYIDETTMRLKEFEV